MAVVKINERISVETRWGQPRNILWRGQLYDVLKMQVKWGENAWERLHFRVQTPIGGMEIFHSAREGWILWTRID